MWQIRHPRDDGAYRSGNKFGRAGAEHAMVRHIIHVTVKPLRKPCLKPFFSMRQVDIGDADRIETEFGAPGANLRHKRVHAGRIGWQACIQVRFW